MFVVVWDKTWQNQQKDLWAQKRHTSLAIPPIWSVSLRVLWVAKDPNLVDREVQSDWVNAQVDLNLCWDAQVIWLVLSCSGSNNKRYSCAFGSCFRYYVQRKDTCPVVIPRICVYVQQILIGLKLIFGYMAKWQQIHRTVGQRTTAFHWRMDHVSKN